MANGTFEIVNELGLHARAATKLVQLATRFDAKVELEKDGQRANAKSVMGVLLLCGARVLLCCSAALLWCAGPPGHRRAGTAPALRRLGAAQKTNSLRSRRLWHFGALAPPQKKMNSVG